MRPYHSRLLGLLVATADRHGRSRGAPSNRASAAKPTEREVVGMPSKTRSPQHQRQGKIVGCYDKRFHREIPGSFPGAGSIPALGPAP
jgi:hypothetical protein